MQKLGDSGHTELLCGEMAGLSRPPLPCVLKLGKKDGDARDKRGMTLQGCRNMGILEWISLLTS